MNIDNTSEISFLIVQSFVSNKSSCGGLPNCLPHEIEKKNPKQNKRSFLSLEIQ
jgi:hypothetical protein